MYSVSVHTRRILFLGLATRSLTIRSLCTGVPVHARRILLPGLTTRSLMVCLSWRDPGGWLPQAVEDFRAAVDGALPGMYCWFEDQSLHVTLRGLLDP